MGLQIMDPSYGLYASVEVEQDMGKLMTFDDTSRFSHSLHWTPISNTSEYSATADSYPVGPDSADYHQRLPSHVSSSSLATSAETGEVWRSESISTADHLDLQRGSLSLSPNPNRETHSPDERSHSDGTVTESPFFQSPYGSNGPSLWSPNDVMLRPGPASPAMMSPPSRSSPSIPSGEYAHMRLADQPNPADGLARPAPTEAMLSPDAFSHRSTRQPSQSPRPADMRSDAQRASISPTQSVGSITKKSPSSTPTNAKGRKTKTKPRRTAHNAIEKRYRIRLNDKIAELRDSIPSLRAHPPTNYDGHDDEFVDRMCEGATVNKVNKANVLEKATEYVKHLESCNRRLEAELHRILNISTMNELGRQGHCLPSNYAMMETGQGNRASALLPRNHVPERCTYPVRDHYPGGELMP